MGALIYHEKPYGTEHPQSARRTLEVATFDNAVDIRISAVDGERLHNGRLSVILSKQEAAALIADLQRAADYLYDGD